MLIHGPMNRSSIQARLIAVLCLTTLIGSWSHFHSDGHAADSPLDPTRRLITISGDRADDDILVDASPARIADGTSRLSSDDAHHEHSSKPTLEIETCLLCRRNSEDEPDRSRSPASATFVLVAGRMPRALGARDPRVSLAGQPPSRAPPTGSMHRMPATLIA